MAQKQEDKETKEVEPRMQNPVAIALSDIAMG